jgi:hypothetical protein
VVGQPGSKGNLGLRLIRESKEKQWQAILGQLSDRLQTFLPAGQEEGFYVRALGSLPYPDRGLGQDPEATFAAQ